MKKLSTLLLGLVCSVGFSQELTTSVATSYSNVIETSNNVFAACEQGIFYETPKFYVGDFSTVTIANQFVIDANTTFSYNNLEMNVTVPENATVTSLSVKIYSDVDGFPGEELFSADLEPMSFDFFNTINFSDGTTAEEYIAVFDLSSFPQIEAATETKLWIATKPSVSQTPARHTAQDLQSDIPTMIYSTTSQQWRTLAVTSEPDVALQVPFTLRGDCSVMGTNDLSNYSFTIYPNPVKDIFNISLKNEEIKSVTVSNLNGKVVSTSKSNNVNISALPAGVYLVTVKDVKGNVQTSKIVKK